MWPGSLGAHSWQPMSFSPDTGLVYIPGRDIAGYYNDRGIDPKTWQMGRDGTMAVNLGSADIPKDAGKGWLVAWDPLKQKEAWRVMTPGVSVGGTIVTHGGLVFQPSATGRFNAFDANSGANLWSYPMGVGSTASPITFSVNGRQYVSVLSGFAGQSMMLGSVAAQYGWVGRAYPRRLLTFALDAKAPLPPSPAPAQAVPLVDATSPLDGAAIKRGSVLFGNCVICHGLRAVAGGYAPDLRASAIPTSAAAFQNIVRGGALETRGMPQFAEFKDQDLDDLRQYIRCRARSAPADPSANEERSTCN